MSDKRQKHATGNAPCSIRSEIDPFVRLVFDIPRDLLPVILIPFKSFLQKKKIYLYYSSGTFDR